MDGRYSNDTSRAGSVLNLLAGIWLIISPWVVGFTATPVAVWNTVILGIVILVLAAARLGSVGTTGLSWINLLLGIWLIISPFVLNFGASVLGMRNDVIVGILVVLFSLWAVATTAGRPTTI
jgi:hypothetical protein